MNCPDVVSIGIVWDSEEPEVQQIVNLVHTLGTTLRLADVSVVYSFLQVVQTDEF